MPEGHSRPEADSVEVSAEKQGRHYRCAMWTFPLLLMLMVVPIVLYRMQQNGVLDWLQSLLCG
jgi:hypothetical protein